MKVIGLDLSLTGTGWCIVLVRRDGKPRVLNYGVIRTKSVPVKDWRSSVSRIDSICKTIEDVMNKYEPEMVGLEGYSYLSHVGGKEMERGELAGMIKWMLWRRMAPEKVFIFPPTHIKKIVTGHGHADKDTMLKFASKISGKKFNRVIKSVRNNASDAFGVAYALIKQLGY